MSRFRIVVPAVAALTMLGLSLPAADSAQAADSVNVDNFVRAESDLYLANIVKDGGLGKFMHRREPAEIDRQTVIRLNRDTLYSAVVLDLDAGPATVTLPPANGRFMSLLAINEDHYVIAVSYGGATTISKEPAGTRYAIVGIRTFIDPSDASDVKKVHALQDAIKISQENGPGTFAIPAWDAGSQKKVRDALLALATTLANFDGAFGSKNEVDPVHHLIGSAAAWGGNPRKDAIYLNVTPPKNDGKTAYKLTVKDVPVDGFWSISLYNAEGYFQQNDLGAYSLNNVTARKSEDGSVHVQFGKCDGKVPNCLPITDGWNYTVRLYRPQRMLLDGKWSFPEPQPAD